MIHFYSTKNKSLKVSLEEAVMKGLAVDGGLFMPDQIPHMDNAFFDKIDSLTFSEISYEVCRKLLQGAIPDHDLKIIIEKAINFEAPLKALAEGIFALELFHGPTLSFKDFGARFMAQLMGHYVQKMDRLLHILVATSGDTGGAIADAFFNVPGIQVWILYPKGKVSLNQEKQFTTRGHNIFAVEVDGSFDDCQKLVKQAFSDNLLRKERSLTSANSINIARLIPQSFYYFYAYAQIKKRNKPIIFSVPSGNFGNLTAGLLAKKMGLPATQFVAATNLNDSVPKFLSSGIFEAQPSKHTLSNAMDVGNPSNFARMLDLYDHQREKMKLEIYGVSFTDEQTKLAMRQGFANFGYLMDPHGAVAYLGLQSFLSKHSEKRSGIFLETAHPAKFADDVEAITGQRVSIPIGLEGVLKKQKQSIVLSPKYDQLRDLLLGSNSCTNPLIRRQS